MICLYSYAANMAHGRAKRTIRQPRDRLKGQPQEREHSDAAGGTRDRLPPARGSTVAAAIVTRMGGDAFGGAGRGFSRD